MIGSTPFTSHLGCLEGGTTRSLGDLRSPWLLTTYWDEPPSVGVCCLFHCNVSTKYLGVMYEDVLSDDTPVICHVLKEARILNLVDMGPMNFSWKFH